MLEAQGPCADARDRLIAALTTWHINEQSPGMSEGVTNGLIQLNVATDGSIERIGVLNWPTVPLDRYTAVETERDHYRKVLVEIAHLEDSPAASAHIAATALGIELPPHLDRGKGTRP